ncbi:hypothetical protein, partial [Hyella patelloides]|uniref:hypothetical protein n=1 Tax=Hyella patelloides TaxID=1982969 RepID=UPI001C97978F
KNSRPKNRAIGTYLKQKNLLLLSHINILFQLQLEEVNKLFTITSAEFKFEEINNEPQVSSSEKNFPWEEMTGKQKKATKISLEAMRDYFNWDYLKEKMPFRNSGLNKLVDKHDFQLLPLETYLWNTANSNISLRKIAQEKQVPLEKIQQTALSMIFAGLLEEVSIINMPMKTTKYSIASSSKSNFADINNTNISNNQPKISNSLLSNLIAFLRKHF